MPAPGRERPDLINAYEPPMGAIEQVICEAFSVLLDLERVGRHDNFFELGGNSLLATRLLESLKNSSWDECEAALPVAASALAVTRISVSYTHLDVYKRQVSVRVHRRCLPLFQPCTAVAGSLGLCH